jgi:hypothetical protein
VLVDERSFTVKMFRNVIGHAIGIVLNTDAEGALPILFAATAPDATDVSYFGPQCLGEMYGDVLALEDNIASM